MKNIFILFIINDYFYYRYFFDYYVHYYFDVYYFCYYLKNVFDYSFSLLIPPNIIMVLKTINIQKIIANLWNLRYNNNGDKI